MKYLCLLGMAIWIIAAIWYDVVLVSEFVALPDTALLWVDGKFFGWFQIAFLVLVFDFMAMFPIWLMWESFKDLVKDKK